MELKEISNHSMKQYLAQEGETANTYLLQMILAETNKEPQSFLKSKGMEYAEQMELISGQTVIVYNKNGDIVSRKGASISSESIKETLEYASNNKTAYLTEKDSLYYLTPLKIGGEQIGVIQFHYSLRENIKFYNYILRLLIYIGTGVFIISFILAYFYFNSFARGIIKLNQMVYKIREGQYDTTILRRRDEIGNLSEGIHAMSGQIRITIQGMEEEQRKLSLAVNKLSKLDQQQKQFIGSVTHEFKTPLTSIKAYTDLLEMYPDDRELLETAITNIKSETNRLYEMVDKVLQLSQLEKYEFEFQKEKVDIKLVIQSVLGSLQGKIEKFGIKLETDLSKAYIAADKDSMIIILVNLIDNAIKYNKPQGSICVKNYVKEKQVIIEIMDSGIGIPKEVVPRIFEPFYMVDKNRARQYGGAGLGLSLVKKYTEIQGGSIKLVKTSFEGSVFAISFPLFDS